VQSGVVLISPVLINAARPARSVPEVKYEFRFSLLRSEHAAVLLEGAAAGNGEAPGGAVVAIAGGTSRHLLEGFGGSLNRWEIPVLPGVPLHPPQGQEAADVVLFRFNPAEPAASRLEVVEHPAPDPGQAPERVHFAAVGVPGYGLVLAGGEPSGDFRDNLLLRSAEIFLPAANRLAPLAVLLAGARARHQGYLVEEDGLRSIFLIGGLSEGAGVEEIPLR
jgi:hypothetical protein